MKNKSTLLISFLLIATVAFIGCKEEEKKTEAPPSELPSGEQEIVAGIGVSSFVSCFSQMNGNFLPLLDGSGWKTKDPKDPPEGWEGPDANGWYTYDHYSTYYFSVRFSPGDPWAIDTATFWQVEWKMEYYDTTYQFKWYARCAYANEGADIAHIEGEWKLDFHYVAGEYNLSYMWKLSYDNVAVALDDYSGHFLLECSYPYISPTTGQLETATLTGEFTFESSGEGTGYIAAGGTEVVRYTFNCISGGNYTLLYENWATQHPFGSCGK